MRNPALKRLEISLEEYRKTVTQSLSPHRLEILKSNLIWIQRTEPWIKKNFIHGGAIATDKIKPRIEHVVTEAQHALWRYCRLLGSIPYNRGCGRLLRYLLRDDGQPGSPVMGILALSSPILINKPRDQWIGWEYPKDSEKKRRKLLSCMDLTVSMAVPPYNCLTAGKMICLAALSNEVRQDYWNKFNSHKTPTGLREGRLVLITTTSLYGSSVQYNRIRVNGRLAYQFVGYTNGFGNAHITESEFLKMERYLERKGKAVPKGWGTGRSYRLRVYNTYYRIRYGTDAPPHENPRSVYVAPLASNARNFLTGKDRNIEWYDLPFAELAEGWRKRWLSSRLQNPDVLNRLRSTDPTESLLTRQLVTV